MKAPVDPNSRTGLVEKPVGPGDATQAPSIPSSRALRLVFRLHDGDGLPLSKGDVVLSGRFPSEWTPPRGLTFQTNRVVLRDPNVLVVASAPGYMSLRRNLVGLLPAGNADQDPVVVGLQLIAAERPEIRMRVVDAVTGDPVTNAVLRLKGPWRRGAAANTVFARSAEDGALAIALDYRYRGQIEIAASGYLPRQAPGGSSPVDIGNFELTPDRWRATLQVRLAGHEQDEPWGGFLSFARIAPDADSAEFRSSIREIDSRTRSTLEHNWDPGNGKALDQFWTAQRTLLRRELLWRGEYLLFARDRTAGCCVRRFKLEAGASADVQLRLQTGCFVRPAVTLGGDTIVLRHTLVPRFEVRIRGAGEAHVPEGNYKVTLRLSSGGQVPGGELRVPVGGTVEVPLPKTDGLLVSVTGRLVLDEDDSPIADQDVQIAGSRQIVTTDQKGRFEIPRLTASYFNLLVPGYRFAERRESFRLRVKRGLDGTHDIGELRVTPSMR